ncbi:MAG: DUF4397 domain-containing protein [Terriglobales bacterium]
MRFYFFRRVIPVLFTAIVTLLSAGCGSGSGSKTQLRALQASPNESTTINVLLDSTTLFSDLALGAPTTYSTVTSGSHTLEVEPSNSTTAAINQSVTLNAATNYTLITANYAANLTPMLLTDSTTAPSSGDFGLRIANAAVEAGSIDVYILPAGSPGPPTGGVTPTISALGFTNSSSYQSLSAGSYEIVITPAGFPVVQYINSGSLSFAAGQNRTFVILPNASGGLTSLTLSDLN